MKKFDRLNLVRSTDRINLVDIVENIFDDCMELHGDRNYGDDQAVLCEIANISGEEVMVIGQRKGSNLEENIKYNFAMAHPEGYRKAIRLAKMAEKFDKPIIFFMDTSGAYPGIASEERGQGQAIANILYELSDLRVPIVSILISEGGSGGAIAFGVADTIIALENAYYSVISPEGYAEILYKGKKKVEEIIDEMPIFTEDLLKLEIIEEVVQEPVGGATKDNSQDVYKDLKSTIISALKNLQKDDMNTIVKKRYERFRKYGV